MVVLEDLAYGELPLRSFTMTLYKSEQSWYDNSTNRDEESNMNRTQFENTHQLTITNRGWTVAATLLILVLSMLLAVVGGIELL